MYNTDVDGNLREKIYYLGGIIMPRIARKNFETSFFHVIVQGVNKEYIFNKNEYIESYLSLLNKYKDEFQVEIIAYCIMNNHAHMLIFTERISELSKFMHKINAIYAQYYNEEEKRVGHVFRDRFKSEPIISEEYLVRCIKYIHQNPVKAGITQNCGEYRYSTYNQYLRNEGVAKNKILNEIIGKRNYKSLLELEDNIIFYDIDLTDNEMIDNVVFDFKRKYKKTTEEILKDDEKAKEIVKILKEKYGIAYRIIEKNLNISKRRLQKIKQ